MKLSTIKLVTLLWYLRVHQEVNRSIIPVNGFPLYERTDAKNIRDGMVITVYNLRLNSIQSVTKF